MKKHIKRIVSGTLLGITAALLVWLAANYLFSNIMYDYEARTYDWRVVKKIQDVKESSIDDVVIIDIDGRAVSELGKFSQWPRNYYPKVINYINSGGAKAIALDIIFDKDIWRPEYDDQFINTVKESNNVYNALYFGRSDTANFRYEMHSPPKGFDFEKFAYNLKSPLAPRFVKVQRLENEFFPLLNASKGCGHVNFSSDEDGVVRSIHLFTRFNEHIYPTLALKIYMDLSGIDSLGISIEGMLDLYKEGQRTEQIPMDENGFMRIQYFGTYKTFRYISFYDILNKNIPAAYFKDKIVFVGTSLAGLFDLRSTPMWKAFPGVEIHANIMETLLKKAYITHTSPQQSLMILLSAGILLGILMSYMPPLFSVLLLVAVGLAHIFVAAMLFFNNNLWLDVIAPLLTFFLTFTFVYLYRFATEERNKRFIRNTFSHFVTKSVVDELLANPDKIKLGGERKTCTVFFSDVAGFTTISEKLSPEELVRLLNDYLTEMTDIVFKYNGMLDKYEGDAIMAVFGAPVSHSNDAYNACAAALEMQEALIRMRAMFRKQGREELFVRMGINTGTMVVGNMGSETRFDYTVMGDAVNLGARLEPANKEYGTKIMIGPETYKQLGDRIITRHLDLLRVKGKNEPVNVYELVELAEKGVSDEKMRVLQFFKKGLKEYLNQNWDWAINFFEQALSIDPQDNPSKNYAKRCQLYKANPPGTGWDGVFIMTTK